MLATTIKIFDKRDRALAAAIKEFGSGAKEGSEFELSKDENKRWFWTRLNAIIEPQAKSRVYDVSTPNVHGTVVVAGPNVSEVKWDKPEPWGKVSNTINKNLRFVIIEDGIPDALKVANRKPLTPEQEAKLKEVQHNKGQRGEEKHNVNLPRNIEPAGLAILQGKQESKRKNDGNEKPTACHRLRQLIVKNPMWDVDTLLKQLESEGYNKTPRSTVSTFRSDTRATLKALVAEGLINIEL